MSLRKAGALIGVKAPTVQALRDWVEAGADPDTLRVSQRTLDGIRRYMKVAGDVDVRRTALRIAADRLQQVVTSLREEADSPTAGATLFADAGADAIQEPKE